MKRFLSGRGVKSLLLTSLVPIVVLSLSVPFVSTIRTSYDTRVFLGERNVYYQDLQQFEKTFHRTSQVFILLRHGSAVVTDPEFASIIESITNEAWQLPSVTRVDSLANAPHVHGDRGSIAVDDALKFASSNPGDQVSPLASNLNLNRYVSLDRRVASVIVTCDVPVGTEADIKAVSTAVEELVARYERSNDDLTIYITGEVPLMDTFGRAANADAGLLVPVALLIVVGIVQAFLRSWRLTLALVANAIVAISITMFVFSLRDTLLNSATTIIPLVLLVVLSANSLHLLLAVKSNLASGIAPDDAVAAARSDNTVPILLAAITTTVGFMLLNAADAPPFHDLGTHVALGVAVGTATLLLWVPPFLRSLLVLRNSGGRRAERREFTAELGPVLAKLSANKRLFAGSLALGLIGLFGLSRLQIDDDFVKYFDGRYEIREASEFAADYLGGPNYLDIQVFSAQGATIYSEDYQERVYEFAAWLRARPNVANVTSIPDVLQEVRRAFGVERDLGDLNEQEIAQYLLTFELSLRAGQDLTDYIDIERESTRVNALLRGGSSQTIIELEQAVYNWFAGNAPKYDVLVTGINVPTAHMSLTNIYGMLGGVVGSICLIGLVVGVHFRSFEVSIVGMLSVVLPILMGFGYWGWLDGTIGVAGSAVAAATIGVVIDDAIHLFYHYRRRRQSGREPTDAVLSSVSTVGPAVVITSVALILGFGLLGFSGFEVNRTLGLCTALILFCALLVDLCVLPRLLVWLEQRRRSTSNFMRAFDTARSR